MLLSADSADELDELDLHEFRAIGHHLTVGDHLAVEMEEIGLVSPQREPATVSLINKHRKPTAASAARPQGRRKSWLIFGGLLSVLLIAIITVSGAFLYAKQLLSFNPPSDSGRASGVKCVILMIADGMGGSAAMNLARSFFQYQKNNGNWSNPKPSALPLDRIHVGSVRTRSYSSLITDSAAAATAFSCGLKTYNGAIGMDANSRPCRTLFEAAHSNGYATGLVSTSRVTHATPASFIAHVPSRSMEEEIAVQQLFGQNNSERSVDMIFGGGAAMFQRDFRHDKRNLVAEAKNAGWTTFVSGENGGDRAGFDKLNVTAAWPVLGLIAPDHAAFEIDRDPQREPSLAEMTLKALLLMDHKILHDSDDVIPAGFLLMIEGSRIDMAEHLNDPASLVYDTLAYNDAAELAMHYVDTHPGTVLISVADHETGGLSAGRIGANKYETPKYLWKPEILAHVKSSAWATAQLLSQSLLSINQAAVASQLPTARSTVIRILNTNLGTSIGNLNDTIMADTLIALAAPALAKQFQDRNDPSFRPLSQAELGDATTELFLADLLSRASNIGWTTLGHTAGDVNLYVYSGSNGNDDAPKSILFPLLDKTYSGNQTRKPDQLKWWAELAGISQSNGWPGKRTGNLSSRLTGNIENTDLAVAIAEYLGLNLHNIK